MKLLIVGSKSIHLSTYIKNVSAFVDEIYFLTEDDCNYEGTEEEFRVNFRQLNPIAILSNYKKTQQIIRQLEPTIIHIHQVNRLAFMVARIASKLKIPIVTTAWGSDVLTVPKQNAFFKFLVTKTLQRSRFVTADSLEMISAMQKLVPSNEKYIHLQYGIELVTPAEKENVIFTNRIHEPLYRIDQVIRYFEEMNEEYADWKLVIGAIGSQTESLKQQVAAAGLSDKVNFAGWLEKSDNHSWYAQASIYISIPSSDGTAVSLLEAMSAGCIPVLPDLAVSKEWISDGNTGIIEKNGVNPLREAMKIDRVKCAEKNRAKVEKVASRSACMDQFAQLYQNAIQS